MSGFDSALYVGRVMHQRLRPHRHALRYRLFGLLVDLDELPALARGLRLFSYNGFNLFSLYDRDFGEGDGATLRVQVERHLARAGMVSDGPIRMLAMPRVLGYVFNPLTIFFCHDRSGALAAILYEVHNTFGERHVYLAPVEGAPDGVVRQSCDKAFHVSPFMDMGMRYRFRARPPDETFRIGIVGADADGPIIAVTQTATRVALTDAALAKVFATHPLLTLKVIGGIHWEALRIWLKGVKARRKPPAPQAFVTVASSRAQTRERS